MSYEMDIFWGGFAIQVQACLEVDSYPWNLVVDAFALNDVPVYLRHAIEPPPKPKRLSRNASGSSSTSSSQEIKTNEDVRAYFALV